MPFDGATRYEIQIAATDRSAQAFASVDRRLKALEVAQRTAVAGMSAGYNLLARAIVPLASALTAAAVAHRAWSAGMKAADLGEQAEQLGVNTDLLQAYRYAADQVGVTHEQLDGALMKLTRSMGSANAGSDEMIDRFTKLGVKLLDGDRNLRSVEDVLPEVARGVLAIGSESERSAVMMDLFGRSGARMITMLQGWAAGNEEAVSAAKRAGAVMSGETIAQWDALADSLKRANSSTDVLLATLTGPAAGTAAGLMDQLATSVERASRALQSLPQDASFMQKLDALFGGRYGNNTMGGLRLATEAEMAAFKLGEAQKRLADLESQRSKASGMSARTLEHQIEKQRALVDGLNGQVEAKARIEQLDRQAGMQQDEEGARRGPKLPPSLLPSTGTYQPLGKTASAAGAKLDERLKDLQVERAALEKALAAFDVRGLETVAEVDKRLDAQVKLDQKISSVLKDVPPNSPLAQQLIQEATAVSQLNARLDERKRLLTEAEQVIGQYGDGSRAAARATADLNAMLAAGAIDADTFNRALKATKDAAAEQERAARGAKGGLDGFMAGVEQYGAEVQKANSAFEMGKFTAQEFGSVFSGVNQGLREGKDLLTAFGDAGVNALGRIADKLIDMAAQDLFGQVFGASGGGGGILNLFGGGSSGTSGGLFDGIMNLFDFFPTFAEGGTYQAGMPRIVGEKGWELDVPRTGGTVYNQRQLASLLGGGRTESRQPVIVQVYANEGFVTATAENAAVQVVNRTATAIENRAVKRANESAPAAVERANALGGGDWRFDRG